MAAAPVESGVIRTVLFDLSEVLIAGLIGIEQRLAEQVGLEPSEVLEALGGDHLVRLLHGQSSEDEYLDAVLDRHGWSMEPDELKALIRSNFHTRIDGMDELLAQLSGSYELVLLSDHCTEWVEYIQSKHPFLELFERQFYSCTIGHTKRDRRSFQVVLAEIGRSPGEVLFVDDSQGNVETARSLCLNAIRFTSAEQLREEMREHGIAL